MFQLQSTPRRWLAIAIAIAACSLLVASIWIAHRGNIPASAELTFEPPEKPSLDPLAASVFYANAFRRQLSKGEAIEVPGSHLTPGSLAGQTRSPDFAFLVQTGFLAKEASISANWRILIDVTHECIPDSNCEAKAVATLLADGYPVHSTVAFDRNTVAPADPISYFTPKGFSSISGLADFSKGR